MNKKPVYVAFANKKIEQDFERLKEEKFELLQLAEKLASKSKLTEEDVVAFNKKIKASATKRFLG